MSKPAAKRGLSYHNAEADDGDLKPSAAAASATAKKPTKKQKITNDVALLKSIIGEVQVLPSRARWRPSSRTRALSPRPPRLLRRRSWTRPPSRALPRRR